MNIKKKITLFITLCFITINIIGNNNFDTIVFKIKYKCYHIYDTTLANTPTNENMILYIGKQYSLYKSLDKLYNDSILEDGLKKGKDILNYQTNGTRPASKSQFIKKYNEPTIINQHIELIRNYLIKDNIDGVQNWQITNETKKIENLNATKATCHFRGRDYVAWFCEDIPIQNGPWKFGGLPGLILEVTDAKKQIQFSFLGIENVANKNQIMPEAPSKSVKTTLSEFEKIKEAKRNDPIEWINAALADIGSEDRIGEINGQTKNVKQPNRVNNPMELNFETKQK